MNRQFPVPGRVLLLSFALLAPCVTAEAVNRFSIANASVPTGTTGRVISLMGDNDVDLYGLSISLEYDRTKVVVTAVQPGAAVTAVGPDWSDGTFDNTNGRLVWGVVFGTSQASIDKRLTPGANRELLRITVDIVATTSTTTVLNLIDRTTTDPVRVNVMTDANGNSITPAPTLVDSTLTIENLAPTITNIAPAAGKEGDKFIVTGTRFDQPGLAVEVCNKAAVVRFINATSIEVTAPTCGVGPTRVEVCNDFGCIDRPTGFTYEAPPGNPIITDFTANQGRAGDMFFVVGTDFDQPGLIVRVCNVVANFTLLSPDTIRVTAPACSSGGWATVQVCTNVGCDSEDEGFLYPLGTAFLRGDANNDRSFDLSDGVSVLNDLFLGQPARAPCRDALDANDSGSVDISDASYMLNFLFLGGPGIRAPFPDPGLDPTDDAIPGC